MRWKLWINNCFHSCREINTACLTFNVSLDHSLPATLSRNYSEQYPCPQLAASRHFLNSLSFFLLYYLSHIIVNTCVKVQLWFLSLVGESAKLWEWHTKLVCLHVVHPCVSTFLKHMVLVSYIRVECTQNWSEKAKRNEEGNRRDGRRGGRVTSSTL